MELYEELHDLSILSCILLLLIRFVSALWGIDIVVGMILVLMLIINFIVSLIIKTENIKRKKESKDE